MMRPPVPYFGAKGNLANRIVPLLPAHGHYVEPFAGSLAVLLAKAPSRMETVNDIDRRIMGFWRVLRDRPEDLARVCALTPHSRAEHLDAYAPCENDLEAARRVFVILTQGRGATLRRTGWRFYADPAGSTYSMPDYLDAYVQRITACAERIRGVSLECRDALDVIATYGKHADVLLYCDPPYLGSTRSANYAHEMRTDADHETLAAALHDTNAAVVVSGYPSALYDALYADWHRVDLTAWTGNGIRGDGTRTDGARTEVVWSNRPLAANLTLDEVTA